MLSLTERAVYGASMSPDPQLSLNPPIVGLLTLKAALPRADNTRMHRHLIDPTETCGKRDAPRVNSRVVVAEKAVEKNLRTRAVPDDVIGSEHS
jgi:hypothetical protein